jgi:hypothetical protein
MKSCARTTCFPKYLALAMIFLFLFIFNSSAYADTTYRNDVEDCIEYCPATITISGNAVTVWGYFLNWSRDYTVYNLSDIKLYLYDSNNDLVCSSEFTQFADSLKNMQLAPGGTSYQGFTFNQVGNLTQYDFSNGFTTDSEFRFNWR